MKKTIFYPYQNQYVIDSFDILITVGILFCVLNLVIFGLTVLLRSENCNNRDEKEFKQLLLDDSE